MKLTFALTLAASPDHTFYTLRAESPAGSARSSAPVRITPADVLAIRAVLSRANPDLLDSEIRTALRSFGEKLFTELISSHADIRRLYDLTLERAGSAGMRIKIVHEGGTAQPGRPTRTAWLADAPFELLRDPDRDFLALARLTPIVRGRVGIPPRPPVVIAAPLRALVVIAAPDGFPPLDTAGEWERLNAATQRLQAAGQLTLVRLEHASPIAVQRRLREDDFQIIHFIGHSDYDAAADQGVLVLEAEPEPDSTVRPAALVTAEQIGREIGDESGVRLVILNACRTGQASQTDALRGLATNLTTRGVPAVVAMQFPITDRAAKNFAEEFYRALAGFLPIDEAVSEGRRAIINRRDAGLSATEWATPILYLRADSADLFRREPTPTAIPAPPTLTDLPTPPTPAARPPGLLIAGAMIGVVILLIGLLALLLRPTPPSPADLTATAAALTPTAPPALPNLRTTGILVSPRSPAPGELFRVRVTIVNDGEADSGPFTYTWDSSITDPVQLNSFIGDVPNIPPGGGHSISIPFIYGWWGAYDTQIVIDAQSQVRERDELDNRRPFRIDVSTADPFSLDFTTLPDGPVLDLPVSITPESFRSWNLTFTAAAITGEACTPQIVDQDGVTVLTIPTCAEPALVITITRAAISGAAIEISGTGTLRAQFFTQPDDPAPVFSTDTVLSAEPTTITTPPEARAIRQIVLSGADFTITQLTLLPPLSP